MQRRCGNAMIRILSVASPSPASGAGIRPGEWIVSINGEPVLDEIDYQALIVHPHLEIKLSGADGTERFVTVAKSRWESLGLVLDETVVMKPRHCRNHCVFCFIDQMPPGMRKSLYVRDDDWRLSLMMGNYVTLTNVNDEEFARILRRNASPLYISVHATDAEVRCRMLRNPHAGNLLERLTALKNHGLQFHAQIVLCPGYNDGEVLKKTLEDLAALWPSALSVAIVPIGLTRFREDLARIPCVDRKTAEDLIREISLFQEQCLKKIGTRFAFLSDEFYCLAGCDLPEKAAYEDYPQIENGVGMIRQFKEECAEAVQELKEHDVSGPSSPVRIVIPTGVSAAPHISELCRMYAPENVEAEVVPVHNAFFGETITVTGLIVGKDLLNALKGKEYDIVLISASMLRENTECFLDDMTLSEVREASGKPVRIVENNGDAFIRALYQLEDHHE